MTTTKRGPWILKLAVTALLVIAALGVTKPAAAYRECTPQENYTCSHTGGSRVVCGTQLYHYCFTNSCFAQCSGFTNCVAIGATAPCAFPLDQNP